MFGSGKSQYLFIFNMVSFLGWWLVLSRTAVYVYNREPTTELYYVVERQLQLAQTLALFEVIHAAYGLVRSPTFTVAQQVASRLFIVWGILFAAPESTVSGAIKLGTVGGVDISLNLYTLLMAWGITETIRYPYYAMKELGDVPYLVTWLRYTLFIVLYPLGVASELAMVWLALPELKSKGTWSLPMPNSLNIDFHYHALCILAMLAYAPGFPPLYLYMFKQRGKILGKPSAVAAPAVKEKTT